MILLAKLQKHLIMLRQYMQLAQDLKKQKEKN
jgi:hypothetical protein